MQIQLRKIIGISLSIFLLFAQAGNALAIYSPILSKEVSEIKKEVMTSRQQNGVGSWLDAWEKLNQDNSNLISRGRESGTPGGFMIFYNAIKETLIQGVTESFLDGFGLLIGSFIDTNTTITTCLRDDIWALQALQEEVINEMLKAGLLDDLTNGHILLNDYRYLQARIDGVDEGTSPRICGLKKDWNAADGVCKDYWFPAGTTDYYRDCPYGEFMQAIEEAKGSFSRLGSTFENAGVQFGSLFDGTAWALAQKRAVKRAADWIEKNQIKISFGGEMGANSQGLIKGYGLEGLGADMKGFSTDIKNYSKFLEAGSLAVLGAMEGVAVLPQWIISQTAGENTAIYTWRPSEGIKGNKADVDAILNEFNKAKIMREAVLERANNTLTFNLSLNHVSENNLKDIELKMVKINSKILEATDPKAIPGACDNVVEILKRQCKNKGAEIPSCKE